MTFGNEASIHKIAQFLVPSAIVSVWRQATARGPPQREDASRRRYVEIDTNLVAAAAVVYVS